MSAAPGHLEPPTDFRGILKYLGPGLILAGSIVGSGELIATTRTGAEAGFSLLWAGVITLVTVALLLRGSFSFIEPFCTVLAFVVVGVTIGLSKGRDLLSLITG